jgi:hypothetical protein
MRPSPNGPVSPLVMEMTRRIIKRTVILGGTVIQQFISGEYVYRLAIMVIQFEREHELSVTYDRPWTRPPSEGLQSPSYTMYR